jgi:enterochelin esterase family protein
MSKYRLSYGVSATFVAGALAFAACRPAMAQATKRQPTPGDTVKSLEISPDHKVTFRIHAPKASEVSVAGEFGREAKLTKDEHGIWSTTVGPLSPDYYTYTFNVDGVHTVDPRNGLVKPGLGSVTSMFLVPGDEAEFEVTKDVPHGEIRTVYYRSSTLDQGRSMRLYTPPGYEGGSERFPVLYLLHGGGDDDAGWSTIGRAGFIIDNLLAAGKARPMIVVMPNGSLPRPANFPRFTPGTTPSPEALAAMEALQAKFTSELMNDVIPFCEKTYRIESGPRHRALAGLSMGGGHTLKTITIHPDQFAYVAIWSAGLFGGNADDWEKRNAEFLGNAAKLNGSIKLLSISVGDQDFTLNGSKSLAGLFDKHGIKHELAISGGGHTWINWRHYLRDLAPKLFQQPNATP